jgi:hypothetical protein
VETIDFYNRHKGETCLIVGVGPNLRLTPPEWFNYPSFGINTIYHYAGWKPTYYVGVDERLYREDGEEIKRVYRDVPKFVPSPDRDDWKADNVFRFYHRPGEMFIGGHPIGEKDSLTGFGITYRRIMDAVLQIAYWMGFTTMLMIGVQHKPGTRKEHFWGTATHDPANEFRFEEMGYAECIRMMGSKVRVYNISEDTYVPENILPRDGWQEWRNA